jgi:hypothetical protein
MIKIKAFLSALFSAFSISLLLLNFANAQVSAIEVQGRETLSSPEVDFSYEAIYGLIHFVLDPDDPANASVTDLQYAPVNADGLVEYSADFKMLVPDASIASDVLLYNVNNRGGSRLPPEESLTHPLSGLGYTYLVTGWINEIAARDGRLRLHAPIVGSRADPITGPVRYEISVESATNEVNIAGGGHLAYTPVNADFSDASLTRRLYQADPRMPVERSAFSLRLEQLPDSNQPQISLQLQGGLQPGYLYELIYEAKDPVLAGAGMAGIRDMLSLIRYGGEAESDLASMNLPDIDHTAAWGISQSGRLLRQFVHDGFNADLAGRIVFDGIVPIISGGGYGMFNNRFAMPTRTNGQHSNHLYPNDLFPFTYGNSQDPYTGSNGGVLAQARADGVLPKVMHIQTSNEYWLRAGSLPHTNPEGTADAELPEQVRFYTIGGSQHVNRDGLPRDSGRGQLADNHNHWSPISESLIVAMVDWIADGQQPPPSRYPRLADGSLVPSHLDGEINPQAWRSLPGINHPAVMYQPLHVNYGPRWESDRIIDQHPTESDHYYRALVPAVDANNNDLPEATILPPLTSVPLGTFVPWNLRSQEIGAPQSLVRLLGGYIPFAEDAGSARQAGDPRANLESLYDSREDYLQQFEQAIDALIAQGYLLSGFKARYLAIAEASAGDW